MDKISDLLKDPSVAQNLLQLLVQQGSLNVESLQRALDLQNQQINPAPISPILPSKNSDEEQLINNCLSNNVKVSVEKLDLDDHRAEEIVCQSLLRAKTEPGFSGLFSESVNSSSKTKISPSTKKRNTVAGKKTSYARKTCAKFPLPIPIKLEPTDDYDEWGTSASENSPSNNRVKRKTPKNQQALIIKDSIQISDCVSHYMETIDSVVAMSQTESGKFLSSNSNNSESFQLQLTKESDMDVASKFRNKTCEKSDAHGKITKTNSKRKPSKKELRLNSNLESTCSAAAGLNPLVKSVGPNENSHGESTNTELSDNHLPSSSFSSSPMGRPSSRRKTPEKRISVKSAEKNKIKEMSTNDHTASSTVTDFPSLESASVDSVPSKKKARRSNSKSKSPSTVRRSSRSASKASASPASASKAKVSSHFNADKATTEANKIQENETNETLDKVDAEEGSYRHILQVAEMFEVDLHRLFSDPITVNTFEAVIKRGKNPIFFFGNQHLVNGDVEPMLVVEEEN